MVGSLSSGERERYARQIGLAGWSESGQLTLKESTVFVAGVGGLGGFVAQCLAAAGVGRLRLCDPDVVQASNLNRQVLYGEQDIGKAKVELAAERLRRQNPQIEIEAVTERIEAGSATAVIGQADVVVDCLDNFAGRFALNAYAVETGIPLVHGGISGWTGVVTFLHPPETPCFACLYPEEPPVEVQLTPSVTPAVVGAMQAGEAIKHLLGLDGLLAGRMAVIELDAGSFETFEIGKRDGCAVCGGADRRGVAD